MSKLNYDQYIKINILRICDVKHCNEHRVSVSKYCKSHCRHVCHWGHPEGSRLLLKQYAVELESVRTIIKANMLHKGIQEALSFYKWWMSQARKRPRITPAGISMAISYDAEVPPLPFLELAAAYTLLHHGCKGLIKSDKSFIYHLGNSVMLCTPGHTSRKKIGSRRQKAGKFLWNNLGVMLNGIAEKAIRNDEALTSRQHNFCIPLI